MKHQIQQLPHDHYLPFNWQFDELTTHHDVERRIVEFSMTPRGRPSFTPALLRDLNAFQTALAVAVTEAMDHGEDAPVDYLVHTSSVPEVFNLGGDLQFFLRCIGAADEQTLRHYAHLSIDVLHTNLVNLHLPVTTVALIEGTALGAAFEAALSSDVIIAERHAQIGFPEVVFNMFPGMGAYSFLSRRLAPALVERMIMSGRMYHAEELHEMGVIDHLAEPGEGREALRRFIHNDRRTATTRRALLKMRERVHPITKQELLDIADLWVESALSLTDKDQRMMARLVKAQEKRMEKQASARVQAVSA
ncbi:MAG: crotonase/enoyl-CoA hydratase family protein [Gammaproteobacteria bacterium]|nr:crotonase/enoyl-CoA hydratase family protein [Gammaproteobacteria bacterium]